MVPRWIARPWSWLWSKISGYRVDAITIGYWRYYLTPNPSDAIRRHELEHVHQAVELGLLRYWYEYTVESLTVGVWDNRFEKAARKASGQD